MPVHVSLIWYPWCYQWSIAWYLVTRNWYVTKVTDYHNRKPWLNSTQVSYLLIWSWQNPQPTYFHRVPPTLVPPTHFPPIRSGLSVKQHHPNHLASCSVTLGSSWQPYHLAEIDLCSAHCSCSPWLPPPHSILPILSICCSYFVLIHIS